METLLPLLLPVAPKLIAAIPLITTGVENLIGLISGLRAAAKQTGQWTAELDAAFVEALIARSQSRAWLTDAEVKA